MPINIAVFASGAGSNFINLFNKIASNNLNGSIVLLVSNNPNSGAVKFAKNNDICIKIINKFRYKDKTTINKEYKSSLKENKINLILLAGFMKKIPVDLIKIYRNKILNIHPSLLPDYGGKGFFGMNVHHAVFNANEKISGATVHYVNKDYDRGPILIQKKVEIQNCKGPNEIAKKVLEIEHEIFPKAVQIFLNKM
ncbi:MAG: phosphoribosylglycinamide formyltransferase [Candidatus Marinimicrobia bacterium]|nr:phosphoribosylglycinamide formyltransferase [Candidatus Neomarinimicrobiota bacterium]